MTFSLGMGGTVRHRASSDAGVPEEDKCRRHDELKMGNLSFASTKFTFMNLN
jgi:hypothetical protein